MERVRVCIVEDDERDAARLRAALETFARESGVAFEVDERRDGADLVASYRADVDVLFLDIEMDHLDGMETARLVRETDQDVVIFFVTNMIQYALEGYTVNASGYIVKPIKYPQFKKHLQRTLLALERRQVRLVPLRNGRERAYVNSAKIVYVETSRKRSLVHTDTDDIPCSEALQAVEKKLDASQFFRVHASFLVNLAYVDAVTAKDVVVRGVAIPVSKHRKRFFMQALADYKGRSL